MRTQHAKYSDTFDRWLVELEDAAEIWPDELDTLTQKMNNVHAHLLLLEAHATDLVPFGQADNDQILMAQETLITRLCVSIMWLATKHTWAIRGDKSTGRAGSGINIPEIEIFDHVQQTRRWCFSWLRESAVKYKKGFETVLNAVHAKIGGNGEDISHICWGYIRSETGDENLGRFGVDQHAHVSAVDSPDLEVLALSDGSSPMELNFQTMQLVIKSQTIGALRSDIASQRMVQHVLSHKIKRDDSDNSESRANSNGAVKQCIVIGNFENVSKSFLLNEQPLIEF